MFTPEQEEMLRIFKDVLQSTPKALLDKAIDKVSKMDFAGQPIEDYFNELQSAPGWIDENQSNPEHEGWYICHARFFNSTKYEITPLFYSEKYGWEINSCEHIYWEPRLPNPFTPPAELQYCKEDEDKEDEGE
jgi:hypothetical protein